MILGASTICAVFFTFYGFTYIDTDFHRYGRNIIELNIGIEYH